MKVEKEISEGILSPFTRLMILSEAELRGELKRDKDSFTSGSDFIEFDGIERCFRLMNCRILLIRLLNHSSIHQNRTPKNWRREPKQNFLGLIKKFLRNNFLVNILRCVSDMKNFLLKLKIIEYKEQGTCAIINCNSFLNGEKYFRSCKHVFTKIEAFNLHDERVVLAHAEGGRRAHVGWVCAMQMKENTRRSAVNSFYLFCNVLIWRKKYIARNTVKESFSLVCGGFASKIFWSSYSQRSVFAQKFMLLILGSVRMFCRIIQKFDK